MKRRSEILSDLVPLRRGPAPGRLAVHLVVAVGILLSGFATREHAQAQTTPRTQSRGYRETGAATGGTIAGVVRFNGAVPPSETYPVTKDRHVCGSGRPSPRLLVGPGGGVRNAVVMIKEIAEGKKIDRSVALVLNQRRCEYAPHVSAFVTGTKFEILNSDPILHSVHAYNYTGGSASMFNIAQPMRGQRTSITDAQLCSSGIIAVTCDAGHPWMNAYIVVSEHPYVAVTDERGAFRLGDVPPGTYVVRMWHEGVKILRKEMESNAVKKYSYEEPYVEEQTVTVPAHGSVTISFTLALR